MKSKETFLRFAACLLGAISGLVLIMLPVLPHWNHAQSLALVLNSSVKNMSGLSLLLLFLGGFVWSFVLRWPYSFLAVLFQLTGLAIFAVVEIIKNPSSHNLWPFEFLLYGVLSMVPLAGMGVASLLKKQFRST